MTRADDPTTTLLARPGARANVFGVIPKLTLDFVVPIMYQHGLRCTKAWKMLLELLGNNPGRFILYLLFQIVVNIAIGLLVLGAACITCCLACCLSIIPYIGTVIWLPIHMFRRSYSLYYLAQYGPDFNVFPPEPEVVTSDPQWQS